LRDGRWRRRRHPRRRPQARATAASAPRARVGVPARTGPQAARGPLHRRKHPVHVARAARVAARQAGDVRQVVAHVVGARPNYMKMAPVYAELAQRELVDQYLIHTGQHYDAKLSDVFFSELPLPEPDVMLEVGSGSHAEQTARALVGLERAFQDLEPDLVVLPGDVNSTVAGALAAVKLQIPVCHLEAGLRSFDTTMPEEHNRKVADHLSSLLLTPSPDANENLAAEGISGDHVALVGNTMIDTLLANVDSARALAAWREYDVPERGYVLATLHR